MIRGLAIAKEDLPANNANEREYFLLFALIRIIRGHSHQFHSDGMATPPSTDPTANVGLTRYGLVLRLIEVVLRRVWHAFYFIYEDAGQCRPKPAARVEAVDIGHAA